MSLLKPDLHKGVAVAAVVVDDDDDGGIEGGDDRVDHRQAQCLVTTSEPSWLSNRYRTTESAPMLGYLVVVAFSKKFVTQKTTYS